MYKKTSHKIITECPNCRNSGIIKKGKRKTKLGFRQLYYCKSCKRGFVESKFQYKTYGPKVIVSALSYYNLGNTLEESARLTNKRFKVKISKSSVSQWLKEFKNICTYYKLREKYRKTPRRTGVFLNDFFKPFTAIAVSLLFIARTS